MLTLPPSVRVHLASSSVDMRRGHDGLMAIVKEKWSLDPYSGHLFAIIGKRLDRIKLLYFDRGGFVLIYKRFEKGKFKMPRVSADIKRVQLNGTELAMLLEGIDFSRIRRPKHWIPPSIDGRIAKTASA